MNETVENIVATSHDCARLLRVDVTKWGQSVKHKEMLYLILGLTVLPALILVMLYFVAGVVYAAIGFVLSLGVELAFVVSFVVHKLDLAEREEEERNSSI